ncbi:MAG: PssE/Cps14G family polysaccharide biosynthesis glycosyltransferase [Lachnospiraceae bacterium]|nr:PssE/Cps14G family polysaccharide biosynthesis glycosyltransferase [Lachnospiraceae bacterium]
MIFVTLGSQKFPFDRLLRKIDELIEDGVITEEVFAQTGASSYKPKHYNYEAFIDNEKYAHYNRKADIVIAHGGSGAIINAVKLGKPVIAVPRLSEYGEHVDDHQLEIIEVFEKQKLILACRDVEQLGQALREVVEQDFEIYHPNTDRYIRDLDQYLQKCGRKRKKRGLFSLFHRS